MYLKSIELSGFKSFAKKSGFEFNTPVTAVVGPNGSGKSNVAEAFRFALGEQSIKSMRGKRGEDLIWNGSGTEPRANRASVKITLDNSKKVLGVDFSEVVIERVVHRDGINEYLINGSQVRLKDVQELLAGAGIGSSGHHIISQGEADKILSASAKDRKSMIEDALGLRLYQYKRVESERKLEKTFENIQQVEALRKEIAPHLKFLKKQVEKVEKVESMKVELVALAREYFKHEEEYLKLSHAVLSGEREPLDKALEKLHKELATAKSVLEKSGEKEHKDYAVLEIEKEIHKVREEKDKLVRELGRIEGEIRATSHVQKEKTVRLKELENLFDEVSVLSEIKAILKRLRDFISERSETSGTERLEELTEKQKELESQLKHLASQEQELIDKAEKSRKEIEKAKDSSHDAEKAVFRIMSEENEIISKLNLLKSREERLKLEEGEFKRELEEVGHLAGAEAIRYKDVEIKGSELEADRKVQEDRKHTIEKFKIRLEDSEASGGEEVLKEYKDTFERDEFLSRELLDLEKSAESLKGLIKDLEERLATEFSSGLSKINDGFGKLFNKMFDGGEAKLTLTKEKKNNELEEGEAEDVEVEEGLEISVSLPRKKIRGLMMLSGGERALTSIALTFAISQVNPPPFIILDETDAALDESNSKKYGDLVEMLSKHSQLILITHNRETMSRAQVIYGVTMSGNGVSKLLSIAFDEAVAVAK